MELDEMKDNWNRPIGQFEQSNVKVDYILKGKANEQLRMLRIKYRKQLFAMPLAAGMFVLIYCLKPERQFGYTLCLLVPTFIALFCLYLRDYKLIALMQEPGVEGVTSSIRKYLSILDNNGKQHLRFLRLYLFLLIVILETTMHFNAVAVLDLWRDTLLPIRLICYALLLSVQPYVSRFYFNLHFGQYMKRLQILLEQTS